jgi:hypothetical protein
MSIMTLSPAGECAINAVACDEKHVVQRPKKVHPFHPFRQAIVTSVCKGPTAESFPAVTAHPESTSSATIDPQEAGTVRA